MLLRRLALLVEATVTIGDCTILVTGDEMVFAGDRDHDLSQESLATAIPKLSFILRAARLARAQEVRNGRS